MKKKFLRRRRSSLTIVFIILRAVGDFICYQLIFAFRNRPKIKFYSPKEREMSRRNCAVLAAVNERFSTKLFIFSVIFLKLGRSVVVRR